MNPAFSGSHSSARLLLLIAVLSIPGRGLGQDYTINPVAVRPDESSSSGTAMNNYGVVVGTWTPLGSTALHGYYYDGVKHDLGTGVFPRAVSDNGLVTGELASGEAFLYDRVTETLEVLGTLGGFWSHGRAVNDHGEVAGDSQLPAPSPAHAFLSSNGSMIDLGIPTNIGTLATDYTKANALSEAGLVVGEALVGYGGEAWAIPFIYDAAAADPQMLKLDGNYSSGSAWAMNDAGHVVGWASSNIETWGRAFLHDGATMTNLGTIPGKAYTIATAVNIFDEVVGYAFGEWIYQPCCGLVWTTAIKRAFHYHDGAMVDMNTLVPTDGGGVLAVPLALNDSGKVLIALAGQPVVLTPVVTADGDDNGTLDPPDLLTLEDCLGEPGGDPDPPLPLQPPICVRLLDFDQDYDVDLTDLADFQVRYTHPGVVEGLVTYTGTASGTIQVTAAGDDFSYHQTLGAAGPFVVEVWRSGDYVLSAHLDANGNGAVDDGEPWAPALNNPVTIDAAGGVVPGVSINLGPYRISGRVADTDDNPAGGVTLTASGPVVDAVLSDSDGTYVIDGVLGGTYLVTPSEPTLYFYPFDRECSTVGSDVSDLDFEAHVLPTGEVDGASMGLVSAVDLEHYTITIDEGDSSTTVSVYAGTAYSGFATTLAEVTVGHAIEAQYYSSTNLADHIDTDPPN